MNEKVSSFKIIFLSTSTLEPSVQNAVCKNAVMSELWFLK